MVQYVLPVKLIEAIGAAELLWYFRTHEAVVKIERNESRRQLVRITREDVVDGRPESIVAVLQGIPERCMHVDVAVVDERQLQLLGKQAPCRLDPPIDGAERFHRVTSHSPALLGVLWHAETPRASGSEGVSQQRSAAHE